MGIKIVGSNEKKKVLTRSEREKKREYWREKQAESRARRSSQKHRRIKEKDRNYHQVKRTSQSKVVKRSRQKGCLPADPEKFVDALEDIIDKATPRRKALMKDKQLLNTPKSRKKLMFFEKSSQVLKKVIKRNSMVKKDFIGNLSFLKEYRLSRTLATFLGVNDSCVSKYSSRVHEKQKQPRKDSTTGQDKKTIQEFFQRGDVSTNLPMAKRVKKNMEERCVLDKPLLDVYQNFQQYHPEVTASFSTFNRCRPKNVESTRKRPWIGCLCESCANIDLKLKALSQVAARCGSCIKVKNKYEAVALTLYDKEEGAAFNKLKCVQRQCGSCGCDNIVRFYQPLAEENSMATVVYSKWERVKKMYKGKEVSQIMPVSHTDSVTEVIVKLSGELQNFAQHLFVAAWQQNQFTWLQKNVPKSWVVLNMDFAENYTCVAQEEVQSAHWSHNQVTIQPTVAYYRCPVGSCESIVTEHLIFVSEDNTHDEAAVHKFVKLATEHLVQVRGLTIEKEIQLTDGCAAQYKSKVPFTDISFSKTDLGFSVERHFYGSCHGKVPQMGLEL